MRTPYDTPQEVGIAAARAREKAGLSKVALAAETGMSRKRIGHIEQGLTSALGKTPEEWFANVAPIAAATGDLTLIGLEGLGDQTEIVSLRRDVADLRGEVRLLADTLGSVKGLPAEGRRRLLERFDASRKQSPKEQPGDQGQ